MTDEAEGAFLDAEIRFRFDGPGGSLRGEVVCTGAHYYRNSDGEMVMRLELEKLNLKDFDLQSPESYGVDKLQTIADAE